MTTVQQEGMIVTTDGEKPVEKKKQVTAIGDLVRMVLLVRNLV